MAKYNTGKKYNFTIKTGGAKYNGAQFFILVNIFEQMAADDSVRGVTAMNVLKENMNVFAELTEFALHDFAESVSVADRAELTVLQNLAEKLGIAEIMDDLIVLLRITENAKALDEMKQLNAVLTQKEKVELNELATIESLVKLAESCNMKEASKLLAMVEQYEHLALTDRTPRKAISDFLIGNIKGLDEAYEYFAPLGMKFDPERSTIQVMPQTETTYIEMPYVDGSMQMDTVYKNRLFNIVAWSEQGLNTYQKEQMKADIARVLDSTKRYKKKLTFQKAGIAFDVKYSGQAEIRSGASFVKATMPFEADPYGYPLFDKIIYGTGVISNAGDATAGVVNEISGGCTNPKFQMGSVVYSWAGRVPINAKLFINHENLTCYLEDANGKRENGLDRLTGEFQTIESGQSMSITAFGETNKYLRTTIKEKILWKARGDKK